MLLIVDNMFEVEKVPVSDKICETHGMSPPEGLYTFRNEVTETFLSTLVDVIGMKNKNKTDKNEFDKLHHRKYHLMK